jgi:hypothetical protein
LCLFSCFFARAICLHLDGFTWGRMWWFLEICR